MVSAPVTIWDVFVCTRPDNVVMASSKCSNGSVLWESLAVDFICNGHCMLIFLRWRGWSIVLGALVFGWLLSPCPTDVWLYLKWYQKQCESIGLYGGWWLFLGPTKSILLAGELQEQKTFIFVRWRLLDSTFESWKLFPGHFWLKFLVCFILCYRGPSLCTLSMYNTVYRF